MAEKFEKENVDEPQEGVAQELSEKEKPEPLPEGKAKCPFCKTELGFMNWCPNCKNKM